MEELGSYRGWYDQYGKHMLHELNTSGISLVIKYLNWNNLTVLFRPFSMSHRSQIGYLTGDIARIVILMEHSFVLFVL